MTAFMPKRPSVLIVDDSPGVLLAMEKLLTPYLPVTLADGASAALRAVTPDTALVLTDVRMPDMDGLQLARELRSAHPALPVVFMTGIVEESLRVKARELGVLDVLRKPLRPDILIPALQGWIAEELPILTPDAPAPAASPSAPAPAPRPADLKPYLGGLSLLPGVISAAVFTSGGEHLHGSTDLPTQVGAYAQFLLTSSAALSTHVNAQDPLRAVQIEFADRVLVLCPAPGGHLVVVARDTPAASGVKAWLRTNLPAAPRHLH